MSVALIASLTLFGAAPEARAYVVVIGNNQSVETGVSPLRYADDDAARFYELLAPTAARIALLTVMDSDTQRVHGELPALARAPTKENLFLTLKSFAVDMAIDRAAGRESVLSFVYIGHGHVGEAGQGFVSFLDGPLTGDELWEQVVGSSRATYNHLIIDACNSYLMVGSRGESQPDDSGPDASAAIRNYVGERSARYPNTGVTVSTSSATETHEWSVFQGGIFSQEVRSALAGAADVNADGRVEYSELEAFLGAANLAVDDPRARLQAYVQPPQLDHHRPLVDLGASSFKHLLRLPKSFSGRFHLEDARGVRYADGNKTAETDVYLALAESPWYFVRTGDTEARLKLASAGGTIVLRALDFQPLARAARGSVAEAYRDLLFQVPYGPGFYQGFIARTSTATPVLRAEREFPPPALAPRAIAQPLKNPYR